jgi:hypothetical protein
MGIKFSQTEAFIRREPLKGNGTPAIRFTAFLRELALDVSVADTNHPSCV